MANIREISPNNYALFNNGELLTGFKKIEQVAPNSNYYCLWPTSEYFYLYHIVKEKYALNSNNISGANNFSKIDFYSEETNSFVAYRKDENYAHIIFEDGHVESTTFCYVGIEIDGIRTVKTCSDRWFFYDTRKRKYLQLTGTRGYKLDGNLEMILTSNIFVINKNKRGKQLVSYSQGNAPIYSRDYFNLIEQVNKTTFIGKLYNRNIYCIIKSYNIAYPIGYYTSLPKYIKEQNLFIAQKGVSYCFIKGEKEIQNYQWKNDTFIFHGNYVFNKTENSFTWKIFNIHNGHEIPTLFKNIRIIDDNELHLLAEIDGTDKRIFIEEIEDFSNSFINQIQLKKNSKEQNTTKEKNDFLNNVIDNDLFLVKENKPIISDNDMEKNSHSHEESILNENNVPNGQYPYINILDSKLSSDISYFVLVNSIKIVDNHITSNINCNCFRGKTFIIWLVAKNNTIAITESRRSKIHSIIYLKENSLTVNKVFKYKSLWDNGIVYPINIRNTIAQLENDSFELELLYHIFENKSELIETAKNIPNPKNKEKTQDSKQIIEREEKKSIIGYFSHNFIKNKKIESVFQEFLSDLKIDKNWNIESIFYKRKFVCSKTSNYICILFDNDTDSIISIEDSIHYHIYGEGKDKKFDHYFGANANSIIRDSINDCQKRVMLFVYGNENKISFFDEMKCESFSFVPESKNKRNVIIFKFRSLLRNKDIDANPLEVDKKGDSTYQNNETIIENINNLSNIANTSKLQELYSAKKKLQSLGIELNTEQKNQLISLEEDFIQKEIIPIISQTIAPILKPIKRKITFVLEYNSEENLHIYISNKSVCESTSTNPTELFSKKNNSTGAYKKLRVTLPNGRIICENKVVDTLAKVIQYFGADKVAQLCEPPIDPILKPAGVNLVTKTISPKYKDVQRRIGNDWLVFSCTNTITKKRQIEIIANALDIEVTVEIV